MTRPTNNLAPNPSSTSTMAAAILTTAASRLADYAAPPQPVLSAVLRASPPAWLSSIVPGVGSISRWRRR
jgi:hypothetical protein